MTLGILAPYRNKGIGNQVLKYIINTLLNKKEYSDIYSIYLHVQTSNNDAIKFYQSNIHTLIITLTLTRQH